MWMWYSSYSLFCFFGKMSQGKIGHPLQRRFSANERDKRRQMAKTTLDSRGLNSCISGKIHWKNCASQACGVYFKKTDPYQNVIALEMDSISKKHWDRQYTIYHCWQLFLSHSITQFLTKAQRRKLSYKERSPLSWEQHLIIPLFSIFSKCCHRIDRRLFSLCHWYWQDVLDTMWWCDQSINFNHFRLSKIRILPSISFSAWILNSAEGEMWREGECARL